MSDHQSKPPAAGPVGCRLDLAGRRTQRERYQALAGRVAAIDRRDGTLEVRFGPGLDDELLEETLAVERECCPFFRLDYEPRSRLLTVSLDDAQQEPALDAIAYALSA